MSEQKWRYGRPRPFWPWPVGFALVLFALGGAALAVLWGALERYEESTPEAAILRSVQAVQSEQLKEEDVPAAVLPGRFATAAQYLEEARALLEGLPTDRDSLRFVRKGEADGAEEYPRTVIGQRADGAVLLLVIDGRQPQSLGATYQDCIQVMQEWGAVNAANLDGGSSTQMIYQGETVNVSASLYGPRNIPTAFVVDAAGEGEA